MTPEARRPTTPSSSCIRERKGFESYSFQGNLEILKDLIRKDIPVIVLTKTIKQVGKGHYRVVIGFDEDKNQIIFHDPLFGSRQAMRNQELPEGLGARKRPEPVPMDDGRCPRSEPVSLSPPSRTTLLTSINLATAYYRRSDFARSREQWEKVRESLGQDPYPLYSLGMVSLRQGKFAEAEQYALEALGADANSAYAHDVLGLALCQSRQDAPGSPVPRPGSPSCPQRRVHPGALSASEGHLYRKGPA